MHSGQAFQSHADRFIAERTRLPTFDDEWLATRSFDVARYAPILLHRVSSRTVPKVAASVRGGGLQFRVRYDLDTEKIMANARRFRLPGEPSWSFRVASSIVATPAYSVMRSLKTIAELNGDCRLASCGKASK